jgi:ribosomal protein S18 acetylase RimI-like enzyme
VAFEEWAAFMFREDTDPSLYFLAELDGELVGAVLCPWYPEIGWIRQLAVRPDHQGEGLGLALTRLAFAELYARGHRRVGLGVDDWNERARRLYERVGMRPTLEHRRYHR